MEEKSDHTLLAPKMTVPPRARPFSQLVLNSENAVEPSSNKVSLVKKLNASSPKFYYFKEHSSHLQISELEAYCGTLCQFLATAEYAPSVRPYYNKDGEIIGVTSKAFPNFKSNHDDPLQKEDTLIQSSTIQFEQQRRNLIFAVKKALKAYEQIPESSSSFVSSFFSSACTAYKTKRALIDFLKQHDKFSIKSLASLSHLVSLRSVHLNTSLEKPVDGECVNLKHIESIIPKLELHRINDPQEISIEFLEHLDKKMKDAQINLDTFEDFIHKEIGGIQHTIRTKDLKNYRILKGLGVSLTTRFIFKEADNNNSNMSKAGQFFDFDWTKADILFSFKNRHLIDQLIRRPHKEAFACTPNNIEHFPDVIDPHLFYWPTKQPEIAQIILSQISQILDPLANLKFTHEDTISRELIDLFIELNHYLEKIPQANRSYWETAGNFMYKMSVDLRSLVSQRQTEELVAEDTIKHLFTSFNQQLQHFIKNTIQPASKTRTEDKTDIKNTFKQLRTCLKDLNDIFTGLIATLKVTYKASNWYNNSASSADERKIQTMFESIQQVYNSLSIPYNNLIDNLEAHFERLDRNLFSVEDNEVYKSLATHPVFIFHKYKTFLKYILTDKELYSAFAKLNIRHEASIVEDEGQNLREFLVEDELKRIAEVKHSLLALDDFKLFLEENGQYALQLLKEEYTAERNKYLSKSNPDVDYRQVIEALDEERLQQAFNDLCEECGLCDSLLDNAL